MIAKCVIADDEDASEGASLAPQYAKATVQWYPQRIMEAMHSTDEQEAKDFITKANKHMEEERKNWLERKKKEKERYF